MIMILLAWLFSFSFVAPAPTSDTATYDSELFKRSFTEQINEVRRSGCECAGKFYTPVRKVGWHQKLELSATLHARQMARYKFFEHYSKGGKDIGERVESVGYDWRTVGENLAIGQRSISEVIDDWKESDSHCQLLMNPKFREMGAARAGNYWVLHMGVRRGD